MQKKLNILLGKKALPQENLGGNFGEDEEGKTIRY
jgi:hypothetical protein